MWQRALSGSGGGGGSSDEFLAPSTTYLVDRGATMSYDAANRKVNYSCTLSGANIAIYYVYLDVTSLSKVKATVTINNTLYTYTGQKLALASTQPNINNTHTVVSSISITKTVGTHDVELDLSSYSGNYYIMIDVSEINGTIDSFELI